MFLDNVPKLLAGIKEAFDKKDFESLRVAAHSLKPQMSYMGIKEEVSNIFLIEQSASKRIHIENMPDLISHLERVCNQSFKELGEVITAHNVNK